MSDLDNTKLHHRKVAGMVLGTSWEWTTHDREIVFRNAIRSEEHGIKFTKLSFDPGGSMPASRVYTLVKVGNLKPNDPIADDVLSFVMGVERDE